MSEQQEAVFRARGVSKRFALPRQAPWQPRRFVAAVEEVSFEVLRGESLGIVGESGSGKTTLLKLLLGLEKPDAGELRYLGRSLRREVQVVFQDPVSALDPRLSVADIILEPLRVMGLREPRETRLHELLQAVGLPRAAAGRYPHEFSGGQRQRIAIARALAPRPRVLLADEPVSALDVSVRAQVLNLLLDLRRDFDLTLLLVSHDLGVVRHLCQRLLVMQSGRVVEAGETPRVFAAPMQPYTQVLLSAIPTLSQRRTA
ncbi:MAG: ATP-binding cassette domain-containing protein [Candidatus Dormibacteraeota bacterium]|nr:ATP-binding cassette domain-containing protein [Candidatus Dormibacteraeota bacterium]